MSEDDLRAIMRKKFEAMPMKEWCRLTGCHAGHMSEFIRGKRRPQNDMLRALNMRVDYVRNRMTTNSATSAEGK